MSEKYNALVPHPKDVRLVTENDKPRHVMPWLMDMTMQWSAEDIALIQDESQDGDEEMLRTLCRWSLEEGAILFYCRLVGCDIIPFDQEWRFMRWHIFKHDLKSHCWPCWPEMIATSLRLFTVDNCRHHVWMGDEDFLIQLATKRFVVSNVRYLGSIVRIIWQNVFDAEKKSERMWLLLWRVWETTYGHWNRRITDPRHDGLFDDNQPTKAARIRFYTWHLQKLAKDAFKDTDEWTEHAFRNLIIESLEDGLRGQINHTNPTRSFCRLVGMDPEVVVKNLFP